eukprot:CAMPEP_0202082234 /NCGR_PEP_ID=MMETSP0964-20121228/18309_1 /ASSEMBLY_ACC=CAM_ASM_000500 /TAXON_ID=4773 /ORGANISM="Schizochytrium aggregatum, Strain ATCC28209" /LENGTH=282 /DNA_ID=CAMNT_0048649857 /DNA_START=42 /DNA_END=886 /DNA_ORIENTATION=+
MSYIKLAELTEKMVVKVATLIERENELADAHNKISDLRDNDTASRNLAATSEALQKERARAESLQDQLQASQDALAAARAASSAEDNERVSQLSAELQGLRESTSRTIETLKRQLELANTTAASLRKELDASNSERDAVQAKLVSSASPVVNQAHQAQNDETDAKLAELRVQLVKTKRELEASQAKCRQLEALQDVSAGINVAATVQPIAPAGVAQVPAVAPTIASHLVKYAKMRKTGLPEGAIRQAAGRDGVQLPEGFFSGPIITEAGPTNPSSGGAAETS